MTENNIVTDNLKPKNKTKLIENSIITDTALDSILNVLSGTDIFLHFFDIP
jgi:hypothetical protein